MTKRVNLFLSSRHLRFDLKLLDLLLVNLISLKLKAQLRLIRVGFIWVARCVLERPLQKKHVFKVNWRTYRVMGNIAREINRVGNNINQIAKVFNSERLEGGKIPNQYPLPEELSAIRSYTSRIEQELNQIRLLIIGKPEK